MATRRNAAKAAAKAAPKTETVKAEVKTTAAEVKAETPVLSGRAHPVPAQS